MKFTAKTPYGTFTRTSKSAYTHVVVRSSKKAQEIFKSGTKDASYRLICKDSGFVVTWHSSAAHAQKAAKATKYFNLEETTVLGVYAINDLPGIVWIAEAPEQPAQEAKPEGMNFEQAVEIVARRLEMSWSQAGRLIESFAAPGTEDYTRAVKTLTY